LIDSDATVQASSFVRTLVLLFLLSLAADVTSYLREKSTYQQKLDSLTSSSSTEPHELKRAREFVEEAESTIQDVRQRLQEAYVALENFMVRIAMRAARWNGC
jgi:uncharacterized membrane protein